METFDKEIWMLFWIESCNSPVYCYFHLVFMVFKDWKGSGVLVQRTIPTRRYGSLLLMVYLWLTYFLDERLISLFRIWFGFRSTVWNNYWSWQFSRLRIRFKEQRLHWCWWQMLETKCVGDNVFVRPTIVFNIKSPTSTCHQRLWSRQFKLKILVNCK